MSGAEALGFGLAVIPLLISAAEHYDDCVRPLSRYKHFSKEADRYLGQLSVQRTIFRSQRKILLESVTDVDVASVLIREPGQETRNDPQLEEQLSHHLGESKEACITTMQMIEDQLDDIEAEGNRIEEVLQKERQQGKESKSSKAWRSVVAAKLRFSFSESHLNDNLAKLRTLNGDFVTLSNQLKRPIVEEQFDLPPTMDQAISRYQSIGRASRQIYEALGEACTKHTEHSAHFCVEVEEGVREAECEQTHFKFNIAFASALKQADPIWFIVTASVDKSLSDDNSGTLAEVCPLGKSMKRNIAPDRKNDKAKKRVRFHSPVRTPPSDIEPYMPLNALLIEGQTIKDLCDMRRYLSKPGQADVCFGILESPKPSYKSFVSAPSSLKQQSRDALSLGYLMSSTSKSRVLSTFPLYERLRLAKTLAIAVLCYHATPWAQTMRGSDDIYFFRNDETCVMHESHSLSAPHLNTIVRRPTGLPSPPSTSPCSSGIRNALLFRLGILLLEIAYSSTWKALNIPQKSGEEQSRHYPDLYHVRKFLDSRSSGMGLKYDGIVERLIDCGFGCGTDLSKIRLQVAIYRHVICPLEKMEKMEKMLRALQLDD